MISVASAINSDSLSSPDFILPSNLSPTVLTNPISLVGFFINFWNTSFMSVASSKSTFKFEAASSAISRANCPNLPSNIPVIWS